MPDSQQPAFVSRDAGRGKVTYIDLDVGLERHRFHLTFNGACAVETAAGGVGLIEVYRKVATGTEPLTVLKAIVTEGFRGGGVEKPGPLVDGVFRDRPLAEIVALAEAILGAAIVGVDADTGQPEGPTE